MAKDIVMVHGANEGGWCFDKFKGVFETLGWTCHAPDLIGHGSDATDAKTRLVGVGMADYLAQLRTLLKTFAAPPVLLGHSMGGILVQQLAAEGLATRAHPRRARASLRHLAGRPTARSSSART